MGLSGSTEGGHITAADIEPLARGCAILGAGGGGEVTAGITAATEAIRDFGPVPLIPLADVPGDGLVLPLAEIGAPGVPAPATPVIRTAAPERLEGGADPVLVRDEVERLLGRPVAAVMPAEIGGSNGVLPVAWAARLGLPLVDADAMGRAFPEAQMVSFHVANRPATVAVLADARGNIVTVRPIDGPWSERIARAVCVAMGSSALMGDYVLPAARVRGAVIEGSVTRALAIGHAIGRAAATAADPVAALQRTLGATRLIIGRVVDLDRHTGGGFVGGGLTIDGVDADEGRMLRVELRNENLVAFEEGEVRAVVPDLITIVDTLTATAISTESLRHGQRVCVLGWPCDPLWRTERGLAVAGPRAFGYDLDYVPVEELPGPRERP
jgi:uncharacterized protein